MQSVTRIRARFIIVQRHKLKLNSRIIKARTFYCFKISFECSLSQRLETSLRLLIVDEDWPVHEAHSEVCWSFLELDDLDLVSSVFEKILGNEHCDLRSDEWPVATEVETVDEDEAFAPTLSVPVSVVEWLELADLELRVEDDWSVVKISIRTHLVADGCRSDESLNVDVTFKWKSGNRPVGQCRISCAICVERLNSNGSDDSLEIQTSTRNL